MTTLGRAIAVLLMLIGVSALSVLTANVAAFFVEETDDLNVEQLNRIEEELASLRQVLEASSEVEARQVESSDAIDLRVTAEAEEPAVDV